MAETNISSVANRIIVRLEEIRATWGANDELQQVHNTISRIRDYLLDAEEKQMYEQRVRDWLMRFADEVYHAEDLVDEYYGSIAEVHNQSFQRSPPPSPQPSLSASKLCSFLLKLKLNSNQFVTGSNKKTRTMGSRLKAQMQKLDEIFAWAGDFHLNKVRLDEDVRGTAGREEIATELVEVEEEVIEREQERNELMEFLFDPGSTAEDDLSLACIFGSRGSGTTTLARVVFNDEKVVHHFDFRTWVDMYAKNQFDSEASELRLVIKKIIQSAAPHREIDDSLEMVELGKLVREEIKGKRYLLIIEDLWGINPEEWQKLKELLNSNGVKGSKIVITTSNDCLSSHMGARCKYYLGPLSFEGCWNLFQRVAFKQGQKPLDQKILEMGRDIVKICGGEFPVLTMAIGRMFYFKNPETEWPPLVQKLSRLAALKNFGHTENLLLMCYNDLPSHLKQCFAYSSLFPVGHEIDVQTLIKLWMAQGFIRSNSSHCMEELGYEYFSQLLWRFFFSKVETDEFGYTTKCKMHDLMHGLAVRVAGSECYTNSCCTGPRHVSLLSGKKFPIDYGQAKRIRTILLLNRQLKEIQERPRTTLIAMFTELEFLRVLDLHNLDIKKVPMSIGKLKHLRYLDLSENTDLRVLPVSITMLQNLQTLKLSSCYGLQELPKDIQRLVNLRHLEFDWCYSLKHMPRGIGQLTNLRILSEYVLSKAEELSELKDLNNLRGELKIKRLSTRCVEPAKSANMKDKQHLRSLLLDWDYSGKSDSKECAEKTLEGLQPHKNLKELALVGYEGHIFSKWLSSLTNLVKFSLRRCKCHCLPPLSQLPSLEILILDEMTNLQFISDKVDNDLSQSSNTFLPSLKELRLSELPNLRGWWSTVVPENKLPTFPHLSRLIVEDCPKLNSMPLYPKLDEWLVLDNTSLEPFQQTIRFQETVHESSSSSSTQFSPLSKLRTMCIAGMEELEQSVADTIHWQGLRSLKFLRLDYLPNLRVLPDGLQDVTSLQELHIWRCNIESLPEWISKLVSLTRLSILVCPYLASLPEGIGRISSLRTLEIVDCPMLLQRCQRGIGADWKKIAHIPNLKFPQLQSFIASLTNRKNLSRQNPQSS